MVVEDELSIREMIAFSLRREGMEVLQAEKADVAERLLGDVKPDLILLDWMLPGISGIEFARRLRRKELTRDIPIIMLTARGNEDDRVHGLNSGVDDYIVKPFSVRELVARIHAVGRRAGSGGEREQLTLGGLTVDWAAHRLSKGDEVIQIGPTEFRLISFLIQNPDRVYSRTQLLDHVWGQNAYLEERTVDVHIRRLRKTLEPYGFANYIQTVRGAGYRFSNRT